MPLAIGFPSQEYWSGLPCSPAGHLPDPGIEAKSPAAPALQADSLPTQPYSAIREVPGILADGKLFRSRTVQYEGFRVMRKYACSQGF